MTSSQPSPRATGTIAYLVSMTAGLEAFIYRELESLDGSGLKFVLFATKFKKNDVFSPKPHWRYIKLPAWEIICTAPLLLGRLLLHPRLALEALKDGGLIDLVFAMKFSRNMRKLDIRQIHCHFGDHKLFIGYYCSRILNLPLSVTIHAHEFYTNPNSTLFKRALHHCNAVFPIAQKWADRLIHEYEVPAAKIHLNRLFADTQLYQPRHGLVVLSVGRFTPRKGFQHLLEAAKLLTDLDLHFVFVGFGPMDLKSLAIEHGIAQRVTIFGKMDQAQLRLIYQSADILCVPSITTKEEGAEGIPVVLMEGMAMGLPVVATRCGAIEEIVQDLLVDEGSPEQLAAAIRHLAGDEELRRTQGRMNRAWVAQHYSVQNVEDFMSRLITLQSARDV